MSPKTQTGTYQRLLREGLAAFFEKGYHGCGIQHIVDAAEVPKGSFYNHFASKEELALASIESYAASVQRRLVRSFEPVEGKNALEALDDLLLDFTRLQDGVVAQRGCLLANLAAEVATTSPVVRNAARAGFDSWREPLRRLFARGQEEGAIRNDLPAAELADFLLDAWEGALLRMKVEGGSTHPLDQRRRQLVEQFLPPPRQSLPPRPTGPKPSPGPVVE